MIEAMIDTPECERIEHRVHCGAFHQQSPEQHGGDHGDGIGLEEIGRHARAVADIIAHVIRDDGGIPGIIFRDPGLDLADQIRADIGALGEDAPPPKRAKIEIKEPPKPKPRSGARSHRAPSGASAASSA